MNGTLLNVLTIILGSAAGLLLKSKLPDRLIKVCFDALGLFTLSIGIAMSGRGEQILLIVFSLLLGAVTGEMLGLENRLNRLGELLKNKTGSENSRFAEGMVTAFLLFCMGSMTVLGAFEEGTGKYPVLLYTKSLMDGFAALALSSALGAGVAFSVIPLLLYQGGLTLAASTLQQYLPLSAINEISALGGILLIGLGLNLLKLTQIKIINMLPGLVYIGIAVVWFS